MLRELRERKVGAEVAQRTVDRIYAKVDETELIASFLAGKSRRAPLPEALEDPKILASACHCFGRVSSSSSTIGALKRIAKKQDLLGTAEPPEEL